MGQSYAEIRLLKATLSCFYRRSIATCKMNASQQLKNKNKRLSKLKISDFSISIFFSFKSLFKFWPKIKFAVLQLESLNWRRSTWLLRSPPVLFRYYIFLAPEPSSGSKLSFFFVKKVYLFFNSQVKSVFLQNQFSKKAKSIIWFELYLIFLKRLLFFCWKETQFDFSDSATSLQSCLQARVWLWCNAHATQNSSAK